jgi:hypothetical protein
MVPLVNSTETFKSLPKLSFAETPKFSPIVFSILELTPPAVGYFAPAT